MALPRILFYLLFDCSLLTILLVCAQNCPQFGLATTRRGFFCDDTTLRYPYHESTVSSNMLHVVGLYMPLLVIVSVELLQLLYIKWQNRQLKRQTGRQQHKPLTPTSLPSQLLSLQSLPSQSLPSQSPLPKSSLPPPTHQQFTVNLQNVRDCEAAADVDVAIAPSNSDHGSAATSAAHSLSKLLMKIYRPVSIFLLGYACERFFKAIGKSTLGRLRPHFFAVCQPQLTDGLNCSEPLLQGHYIEEYSCRGGVNVTEAMLRNAHLSFPSGHSSLAFYGMVFLALYLQRCLIRRGVVVVAVEWYLIIQALKLLLQLCSLLTAWYIALSRVMDNKHHWSDVLAGAALGTAIALIAAANLNRRVDCEENGENCDGRNWRYNGEKAQRETWLK